jgi:formamidopyrimidine-DNA glycosylase
MPELAEVEWFRKQWNPGVGSEIIEINLHARNRVFRETDVSALREHLIGQKFLSSNARGKRMLFNFSNNNWLGIHLGMTGKIHVQPATYRPAKRDHLVLFQHAHWFSAITGSSGAFGSIMASPNPTGGKLSLPKSFRPNSMANSWRSSSVVIEKRRSKRRCSCKTVFRELGTGWRTKFCGGQRFCRRNEFVD